MVLASGKHRRSKQRLRFSEPQARWLSPVFISLVIAALGILPSAFLDDQQFRSYWRTPKSVNTETLLMFGCGALALAFGALVAISMSPPAERDSAPWPSLSRRSVQLLRRASITLTSLAMAGYAGFAVIIAKAGIGPTELFSGSPDVKAAIGTIPGVTTLTQFGIAAVVCSSVLLAQRGYNRAELGRLLVVLCFGLLRTFVNSERLAIMELVVPVMVVFTAKLATQRGARRAVAQFIPVALLAMVVVLFGFFEYFRSWNYYRLHTSDSFADFALSRLAGYYATATNNGYLNLVHLQWPNRLPYDTLQGFWTAPGIEGMGLYEKLSGHVPPNVRDTSQSLYADVLVKYGNPEFNSECGYAGPFLDYGPVGGIIYFLLAGLVIGLLYRGFCRAKTYGLFCYPVVFTGLLELPRYIYWSYGRTICAWIGLAVVVVLLSRSQAKERNDSPPCESPA
jgi:oligosaccharide repeat unit polymerase